MRLLWKIHKPKLTLHLISAKKPNSNIIACNVLHLTGIKILFVHLPIIYHFGKNSCHIPTPAPARHIVERVELTPGMAKPKTAQPMGYFQSSGDIFIILADLQSNYHVRHAEISNERGLKSQPKKPCPLSQGLYYRSRLPDCPYVASFINHTFLMVGG